MRVFTVAAVVFSVVAIGWSCFTLVDLLALRTYHSSQAFPAVGTIDLQTGDAEVTVVPDATGGQILVDRVVHRGLVRVNDGDHVQGGRLVVVDGCRRAFSWHCSMSITIHTPRQIDLVGSVGDGDLHDRGTSGEVDLSGGDGDITLSQVTGEVSLHVGDGDITTQGLRAPTVSISSGDGDVNLNLANSPQRVSIHSGDGDIDACLPADTASYAVTTDTGDGSVSNQIPTSPIAAKTMTIQSGDGDVTLHLC
jgi:Putative adhesin